jgi:hypothetical protein
MMLERQMAPKTLKDAVRRIAPLPTDTAPASTDPSQGLKTSPNPNPPQSPEPEIDPAVRAVFEESLTAEEPFSSATLTPDGARVAVAARLERAQAEALGWLATRMNKSFEVWVREVLLAQVPAALVAEIETGAYSPQSLEALYRDIQTGRRSADAMPRNAAPGNPTGIAPIASPDTLPRRQRMDPATEQSLLRERLAEEQERQRLLRDAEPRNTLHPCWHCKKHRQDAPVAGGQGYGRCGNPTLQGRACNWPASTASQCSGYRDAAPAASLSRPGLR